MPALKDTFPYWRAEMRYCPYCRRFNEGKPQICHFCGRTWYVRLCPRGHENPYNAQYCGTCGSADLTETAGRRSWFLIGLKLFFLIIAGLSVYFIINELLNLQTVAIVAIVFLIIFLACQLALSVLPKSIGNGMRKMTLWGMKMVATAVRWFLLKVWEILK